MRRYIHVADCYDNVVRYLQPRVTSIGYAGITLALASTLGIGFAALFFYTLEREVNDRRTNNRARNAVAPFRRNNKQQQRATTATVSRDVPRDLRFNWNASPPKFFGRKNLITEPHRQKRNNEHPFDEAQSSRAARLQTQARHIHPRPPWQ